MCELGEVGVQGLNTSREGVPEVPPVDGRDLLTGLEVPPVGGAAREQCRVLGPLVGREYEAGVAHEPQRSVGLLTALLQQLACGSLTRGFAFFYTATGQFPALAESIEDHEDTIGMPDGDQRRRRRRVIRWRRFGSACEGDQGVAAIVDHERWGLRAWHLAMMPGPSRRNHSDREGWIAAPRVRGAA
ncbi:hypothetical protein ADK57_17635 [Streptomyces sp. MMG1533]|nr:hypothetical protein ADK57_17635 [Streptomyces sp. MMG1533]